MLKLLTSLPCAFNINEELLKGMKSTECKLEKPEMTSPTNEYKGLFSDNPTRTSLIEHDVDVGDAASIKHTVTL